MRHRFITRVLLMQVSRGVIKSLIQIWGDMFFVRNIVPPVSITSCPWTFCKSKEKSDKPIPGDRLVSTISQIIFNDAKNQKQNDKFCRTNDSFSIFASSRVIWKMILASLFVDPQWISRNWLYRFSKSLLITIVINGRR